MKQAILGAGVLVLLALLAGVLWFLGSRTEPEVGAEIAERGAAAAAEPQAEISADRSQSGLSSAAPERSAESSAADPSGAEPRRELAGTFAIERANGRIDSAASGTFVLSLYDGGTEHLVDLRVRVESGSWRVACPAAEAARVALLHVSDATSDGVRLTVLAPARLVSAEGTIEVRARESRPTWLRVVDARTGVELAGVELLRSLGQPLIVAPFDAAQRATARVAVGLSSPIDLAALARLPQGSAALLVGAPGYAWTPITVEVGAGTERTVELAAGGDVRLRIEGDLRPEAPVSVVLRRASPAQGRPLESISVSQPTTLVIDGLPAGPYRVSAELGSPPRTAELGSVVVTVVADSVVDATLVVAAAPAVQRAPLSGIVLVPEAWELDTPTLDVKALSPLVSGQRSLEGLEVDPADGEPGFDAFRFAHPGLEVGRYSLWLRVPPLRVDFDLPPVGRLDLRVVAPPPSDVIVRLFEADTGAQLRPAYLFWAPQLAGEPFGHLETAPYSSDHDGYRILTAPGEVLLMPDSEDGIELPETTLVVPAGSSTAAVNVRRLTELDVVLLDAGVPQPFPEGWRVRFFRAEEDAALEVLLTASTSLRRARLPAGGRYRIEFDPFPGYQPLPALEFEALHRQRSRIEVRLER